MAELREEIIGDCRLILGDCLEVMPTLGRVDHVISDPPYEQNSQDRIGGIKRNDGGKITEKLSFAGIDLIRPAFTKLLSEHCSGWGVLFCTAEGVSSWRDEIEFNGIKYKTPMIWVKPDAMPKFNGQGAALAYESIVSCWNGSGPARWNGGGKRGIFTHITNQPDRQGIHPTEKPLPLMRELVSLFSNASETILDPFMGSGTTGVACAKLSRKFIGIELDPKYFDIACRRIEEAYKQPDLFIEPPKKIKQESLL